LTKIVAIFWHNRSQIVKRVIEKHQENQQNLNIGLKTSQLIILFEMCFIIVILIGHKPSVKDKDKLEKSEINRM
jgi:hypothetical protein